MVAHEDDQHLVLLRGFGVHGNLSSAVRRGSSVPSQLLRRPVECYPVQSVLRDKPADLSLRQPVAHRESLKLSGVHHQGLHLRNCSELIASVAAAFGCSLRSEP
jgi:hypothetical protein